MSTPHAAGENYRIAVEGAHATVTVWRRPDLDSAAGARNANEMVAQLRALMPKLSTFAFDLRDAPAIAGPKTVETMSELLRASEKGAVRLAVLVSGDPMQLLQFRRLVATYAPTKGKVVVTQLEADEHLERLRSSRP